MSLWAESLSHSCWSAGDNTKRIQETLRHLSMPVPLSWWKSCFDNENEIKQFAEIIYELCAQSELLDSWNNYGLFVALAFCGLEDSQPYKYSISEYHKVANDTFSKNPSVSALGHKVDVYLKRKYSSASKQKANEQKISKYHELVVKRKKCSLCTDLCNPSSFENGHLDSDQIGPWTLWQGNINAQIMVIGQDWGDISYFKKWEGKDQPSGNPTNTNLQQLLKNIKVNIGQPRDKQQNIIFLSNIILCLKTGGLQGKVEKLWFENCSINFLYPLINIVQPKIIISLGKKVCETILDLYEISYSKSAKFSKTIESSPFVLSKETYLFPMYHCGAGSINRNRSFTLQKQDWEKINSWLRTNNAI